jgi:hypothetical protein
MDFDEIGYRVTYNRMKDLVRCVLAEHIGILRQKNHLKNPQNILYHTKCSAHAVLLLHPTL